MGYPLIRCGGMGVNISDWRLAKIISCYSDDCVGTISGIAADRILDESLRNRDPHFYRALQHFPFPAVTEKIFKRYNIADYDERQLAAKHVPMFSLNPSQELIDLTVCGTFAMVWLAKEGHTNPVSINFLEKIQIPLIYSFVGAMLAGVDCITMGAGIPIHVAGILDAIAMGKPAIYPIDIVGREKEPYLLEFDPQKHFGAALPELRRPDFLPIVSSNFLASYLKKKSIGKIFGFVIEHPCAGGHNAPPRDKSNEDNFVYGPRDEVDFKNIAELELPFWIGGGMASPQALEDALALGAQGIQVGTLFALCEDSGMRADLRDELRRLAYIQELRVLNPKPSLSPTSFPFKVPDLPGTLAEDDVFNARPKICNKGYLGCWYLADNGAIKHRCPAENEIAYRAKGGKLEDAVGRRCLCNGLLSTAGIDQLYEPPITTLGDDTSSLRFLMQNEYDTYTAYAVIDYLLPDYRPVK